jgi:hypothetical protein
MLQAEKMAEVAEEVLKYGMDMVALQEVRCSGDGKVGGGGQGGGTFPVL